MSSKSHDRQKIATIENNVGLTKEQYEKKYLFHRLKERFLHSSDLTLETITPEGHENIYIPIDIQTPTQADGLSYEDEQALRMHGAQICFQACFQLKLPLTTAITSLVIFHRFFTKNSFVDFDYREISMASLFLAGKVEETILKTMYIAGAFSTVFQKQKQNPLDNIIKQEKLILRELGFELFRVSDHPHKFIESFYHFIKVDKQVAQKAWYYLNDSYMTDLCVHFPPQVIAAGALYLAMRVCNHPMPSQPWWILLEATLSQIEQVAATIYNIYEFEKMDFRQARRILAKANRVAYVIKHSEIYGIPEKIDRPIDTKKQIQQTQQQQPQQQQNQQDTQNNKNDKQEQSPYKDKKSIKKKSKSKEKKSKEKKNKSEKKKNKSKSKKKEKKEKKDKKKKSRSRSKTNEKKQSKKEKKKEKEKQKEKKEKDRERESKEIKDNKDQKDTDKDKEKDKEKKREIEKQQEQQEQQNLTNETDQQQEKDMIKSKMEIENDHDQNNNNNNIDISQQNLQGNDQNRDDNKPSQHDIESNLALHTNHDELQPNIVLAEDNNQQRVQQPLQSKQDFITKMKALLKNQQQLKIDDKDKEIEKNEKPDQEQSPEEQDSEEDEQLKAIKLKILAKKRNEQ